jgi:hypothetical protein
MPQPQASSTPSTSHWFAVLLAGLSLLLSVQESFAQVHIKLRFESAQKLSVEYQLPPNYPHLRFEKDGQGAQQIRAPWNPQNACLTIDGDYLFRRLAVYASSDVVILV